MKDNVQIVTLADGREVCLSYGVIVAAFIPKGIGVSVYDRGYLRTSRHFSVTTSRHANHFAGKDAPCLDHDQLVALCAPVKSRL
jgi:hypothetical protein